MPLMRERFSVLKLIWEGKVGLKLRDGTKRPPTEMERHKAGKKKFI